MLKWCFDRGCALLVIVALLPLLIILAVMIKLASPGPVFFTQTRIGRGGREFRLYKFRTMSVKPEAADDEFEAGDRSRVTPPGRLLRKTKFDELPQLLNILRGEMSFVGPRPEVKRWTEVYPEKWKIVHSVRPGMTDEASILFRNEEQLLASSDDPEMKYRDEILPRKLDLGIEYAENHTFAGDVRILLKTFKEVIFR